MVIGLNPLSFAGSPIVILKFYSFVGDFFYNCDFCTKLKKLYIVCLLPHNHLTAVCFLAGLFIAIVCLVNILWVPKEKVIRSAALLKYVYD